MQYVILLLSGFLGGILAGLLGIGGGIIYVFALDVFLIEYGVIPSEYAQFIVANSLFCVFFASVSSSITLVKRKEFHFKEVFLLGVPAVVASLLAFHFIVNTTWFTREHFSIIIIALMLYMLYKTIRKAVSTNEDKPLQSVSKLKLCASGAAGGFVASLSGLGGGVVMVPLMNGIFGVNIRIAKSISLGVITILSFFATINNLFVSVGSTIQEISLGLIIFPVSILIAVGVVAGAPIGVWLSSKMENKLSSVIYAVFLTLFIGKKVYELYF